MKNWKRIFITIVLIVATLAWNKAVYHFGYKKGQSDQKEKIIKIVNREIETLEKEIADIDKEIERNDKKIEEMEKQLSIPQKKR